MTRMKNRVVAILALSLALGLSCSDDQGAGSREFCLEGRECTSCDPGGDCELFDLGCDDDEEQICVGPDYFDLDDTAGHCVLCAES